MKLHVLCAALGVSLFVLFRPEFAGAEWPALSRVVELAKERTVASREADGQVNAAKSFETWAHLPWLTNPYFEFQTARGPSTKDFAFNSFVMIPIEVNGQRSVRIDEADAMVRWRSSSRDDVKARSAAEAVILWGSCTAAAARIEQYAKAELDAKSETETYAARLVAGDSTVLEKSLAEAELARYAQQKAEATIVLLDTKGRLEGALGVAVDVPSTSAEPPAPHFASADEFARRVVEASPTLAALAYESSFWGAQSSRVARDANVPLNFIVNFSRTDFGDFQVGGGLAWNFPLTIRNQGAVAHAGAQRDRAGSVREAYVPWLTAHAKSVYEQYSLARLALDAVDATGIPAAERVVDFTQQGYRAGKTEYLHVLQARRDRAFAYARRLDLLETLWGRYGEMVAMVGELP